MTSNSIITSPTIIKSPISAAPITTTPLAAITMTTKNKKTVTSPPHDVINIERVLTSPLPTLEQHRTMIEKKQQATSPDFLYGSFAGI